MLTGLPSQRNWFSGDELGDVTSQPCFGSTTIVEMHNVLRDTPKTGDTTNLPLLYALAGLSAVGIAVCGVIGFKKKKKEDRN